MDYTKPEMEIIEFEIKNMIYTSGLGSSDDNFSSDTSVPKYDAGGEF